MCHKITAYDNITAYAQISLVIVDTEALIDYLAARKIRHAKRHFDAMSCAVHTSGCNIFYFVRTNIAFILFSVSYFYHDFGSSAIPQAC